MTLRTPFQRLYSITRTLRDEALEHRRHGRELEASALEHYAEMLTEIREQLVSAGESTTAGHAPRPVTTSSIADELGAHAAELATETRYAIAKQAERIGTSLDTAYGRLRITADESDQLQRVLRRLLEARLAALEGGAP